MQALDSVSVRMHNAVSRQLRTYKQRLGALATNPMLQDVTHYVKHRRNQRIALNTSLTASYNAIISKKQKQFIAATAKLDAMSPLKVLSRGFAVVQGINGDVIRTVDQVRNNDQIDIRLIDGTISSSVTEIKEVSL